MLVFCSAAGCLQTSNGIANELAEEGQVGSFTIPKESAVYGTTVLPDVVREDRLPRDGRRSVGVIDIGLLMGDR